MPHPGLEVASNKDFQGKLSGTWKLSLGCYNYQVWIHNCIVTKIPLMSVDNYVAIGVKLKA